MSKISATQFYLHHFAFSNMLLQIYVSLRAAFGARCRCQTQIVFTSAFMAHFSLSLVEVPILHKKGRYLKSRYVVCEYMCLVCIMGIYYFSIHENVYLPASTFYLRFLLLLLLMLMLLVHTRSRTEAITHSSIHVII